VARDRHPDVSIRGYETISDENVNRAGRSVIVNSYGSTLYGVVVEGTAWIYNGKLSTKGVLLKSGRYFTASGEVVIRLEANSAVVVIEKANYTGADTVGVVEPQGRLKYIDGCHDTILQGPIRFGEPVLNALYMPKGVNQTMHTHPSTRAGVVLHSEGAYAETPAAKHRLNKGTVFYLPQNGRHKFRTDEADTTLALVAFHPDSDFGPSDEVHPMINRTLVDVDGEKVSASLLPDRQTKTEAADVV